MIVTEDLLLLKAAANSLTGLRSGESGNVGCVMTAAAGGEVMPATGRQLLGGAPAPEEEERDTVWHYGLVKEQVVSAHYI